jgi:hypothetical protein
MPSFLHSQGSEGGISASVIACSLGAAESSRGVARALAVPGERTSCRMVDNSTGFQARARRCQVGMTTNSCCNKKVASSMLRAVPKVTATLGESLTARVRLGKLAGPGRPKSY